uniref:Transcription factor GTE11-like isoform X1 n=1 Tax=Nicotiana sylvestris TaxID=4096 RepID=A0A1U7VKX8_NICSY|nr:PREDICTED: transcription factor GTE11-like isoform X1 [Nicotiana sylvestris]
MVLVYTSQPDQVTGNNMACGGRKRKISITTFDAKKELEKDDNKKLRAAMLKQRYADMILKSQQQVVGKELEEKEISMKKNLWEKQFQEAIAKSQRKRERMAARFAIENIRRTVDFDDNLQAERDFLIMTGGATSYCLFYRSAVYSDVNSFFCVCWRSVGGYYTHFALSQPQVYVMV